MSSKKKQPPTETAAPAPTPAPAALHEDDDSDVAAVVASFEEPDTAEPINGSAQHEDQLLTIDQLLGIEQRAIDGRWVRWPKFKDAELLLCDFVGHVQEQHRLERLARIELEKKRKAANKEYDQREPLPVVIQRDLEARARFGRAIKGWRGDAFAGRPFNFETFSGLWSASIDFRAFVNSKTIELRSEIERETLELGKA